jgi:hypothetical protein
VFLRAEKRREQMRTDLVAEPRPAVLDLDDRHAAVGDDADGQRAVGADGFHRVLDHVEQRLLDLPAIQRDDAHLRRARPAHRDASRLGVGAHQPQKPVDHFCRIHRRQARRRQAHDLGEAAHEGAQLLGARDHHAERVFVVGPVVRAQLTRVGEARFEQGVAGADGVVHLVRQHADQLLVGRLLRMP